MLLPLSNTDCAPAPQTGSVAGITLPDDTWTDPVTRLVSRRVFDYELARRFEEWERRCLPVSVVIPKVHNLSDIESLLGSERLDQLLREIGQVVSVAVRKMDLPSYQPRADFPVILPDTSLHGAGQAAHRLCEALQQAVLPALKNRQKLQFGVGVACVGPTDNPESLFERAQQAAQTTSENPLPEVRFHDGEQIVDSVEEQTELDRQLSHARRMETVGTLASGVAHEINTPIQYVGDNLTFLDDAFSDLGALLDLYGKLLHACADQAPFADLVAAVRQKAEQIDLEFVREEVPRAILHSQEGTQRVTEIVQSLREFAHPHARSKTPSDLNHVIESMVLVASHEWKYAANVETDFDSDLPAVPLLPGEFGQVIVNLLVNAAHALKEKNGNSAEKGTISISTQLAADAVEVRVTDTGPGIPAERRERIFDPFFTTKPVGIGTGQGLAIARTTIVELHGGTIEVTEGPQGGAMFVIRLPGEESHGSLEAPHE